MSLEHFQHIIAAGYKVKPIEDGMFAITHDLVPDRSFNVPAPVTLLEVARKMFPTAGQYNTCPTCGQNIEQQ